jgi:hypothetical protein
LGRVSPFEQHGIRAAAGGKTVDLVICFQCGWAYVYLDKEEKAVELIIGAEQQPVLDKVLTDAKVALTPPPKNYTASRTAEPGPHQIGVLFRPAFYREAGRTRRRGGGLIAAGVVAARKAAPSDDRTPPA